MAQLDYSNINVNDIKYSTGPATAVATIDICNKITEYCDKSIARVNRTVRKILWQRPVIERREAKKMKLR